MISGSSVFSTLAVYTAALCLLFILRLITPFIKAGGDSVLLAASVLVTIRLFVPIEIPTAIIVESWDHLGAIQRFFRDNPDIVRHLLIIWAIGAVVAVGRDAYRLVRAHKVCCAYVPVDSPQVCKVAKDLQITCPVVVSQDVPGPYVAGFIHYTIYLPVLDLSDEQLKVILSHELQHVLAHDALKKLFLGFLCAVMWWNPAVYLFRHAVYALMEVRSDRGATRDFTEMERVEYGQTLLTLAKSQFNQCRPHAAALDESSAFGNPHVVKQRIQILIAKDNKWARWVVTVIGCLCALVLFYASYLVVFQPASDPSDENFETGMGISYLSEDEAPDVEQYVYNTFIFKDADGRYHLYAEYHFIKYLSYEEVASEKYQDLQVVTEGEQK